ncbi:hypothetical protein [Niveibacterium terrae]|uniref:hypothetical protein n=1 Tax=Niveibacterium terrae TaxID=3373598 RepID=UPI003A95AA79
MVCARAQTILQLADNVIMKKILYGIAFATFIMISSGALAVEDILSSSQSAGHFFGRAGIVPDVITTYTKTVVVGANEAISSTETIRCIVPAIRNDGERLYIPVYTDNIGDDIETHVSFRADGHTIPAREASGEVKFPSGGKVAVRFYYADLPKKNAATDLDISIHKKSDSFKKVSNVFLSLYLSSIPTLSAQLKLVVEGGSGQNSLPITFGGDKSFKAIRSSRKGRQAFQFNLSGPWGLSSSKETAVPPHLLVSLDSWQRIAKEYASYYRQGIAEGGSELPDIPGGSVEERVANAYRWIGKNIRYRSQEFALSVREGHSPRPLRDIIASRHGDCKDMVLLLIGLLERAGIKAESVEVRMGRNLVPAPLESAAPDRIAFNHVIAYIEELDIYLDPVEAPSFTDDMDIMVVGVNTTGSFSGTQGLHLFSGSFKSIGNDFPSSWQALNTVVTRDSGRWLAETHWTGKGRAAYPINYMDRRFIRRKAKRDFFYSRMKPLGEVLDPESWKYSFDRKDRSTSLNFSYSLEVEKGGALAKIPTPPFTLAAYDFMISGVSSPCREGKVVEERIHVPALATPLENVDQEISGDGLLYRQSFAPDRAGWVLTRHYEVRRLNRECRAADEKELREFNDKVKSSILRATPINTD